MTEANQIMEDVSVNQKSSSMGEMKDKTPNQLFKNYLKYFKTKYGEEKTPPTFKQFLAWGRKKGFIAPRLNAEGEEKQPTASQPDAVKDILTDAAQTQGGKISGMTRGKWIALGLLFAGTVGFIYALTRPSK